MYLEQSEEELTAIGGIHTAREISQQPEVWRKTYRDVEAKATKIKAFLTDKLNDPQFKVIFTGAGSSSYVGKSAASALGKRFKSMFESIATTDLIAHPEHYLDSSTPTLLVSYARSGNSPESVAAFELVNQLVESAFHLVFTCNRSGELAKRAKKDDNCLLFFMPEEADDKGFAMTSSYTSMYLATLLAFEIDQLQANRSMIDEIANLGQGLIDKHNQTFKRLAAQSFDRLVYLGSGSLKFVAEESDLKMLELSAGKIATLHNSPLGFRHGPKFFIDKSTFVVIYLSSDAHARQYELDLVREFSKDGMAKSIIAVSENDDSEIVSLVDELITIGDLSTSAQETAYLDVVHLLIGQLFSFHKSVALKITPDNPSPEAYVNRVVQGVTIYPYQ